MQKNRNFSGKFWWKQSNPSFRTACFRKALEETRKEKEHFDYFIRQTNK